MPCEEKKNKISSCYIYISEEDAEGWMFPDGFGLRRAPLAVNFISAGQPTQTKITSATCIKGFYLWMTIWVRDNTSTVFISIVKAIQLFISNLFIYFAKEHWAVHRDSVIDYFRVNGTKYYNP